jgi:hypothetical protein
MSLAVKVTPSATVSVTVKVAWPAEFVVPFSVATTADGELETSDIDFPWMGLPPESSRVAVTVELDTPSAVTLLGEAVRVDIASDGDPDVTTRLTSFEAYWTE